MKNGWSCILRMDGRVNLMDGLDGTIDALVRRAVDCLMLSFVTYW
jgi:hypothetical protein